MIALSVALLVQLSPAGPVQVPLGSHPYAVVSASMAPGLTEGDVVVADRSRGDCGGTTPSPGDVVVVDRDGVPWLRRIVAGPGQTVQMIGGVLHVDGVAVVRERVDAEPPAGSDWGFTPSGAFQVWRETLPGGRSYLTLDFGDGFDLDETLRMQVPEGRWFALGDNRDNSIDDRVQGPTASATICGIVVQIVRSATPSRVGRRP